MGRPAGGSEAPQCAPEPARRSTQGLDGGACGVTWQGSVQSEGRGVGGGGGGPGGGWGDRGSRGERRTPVVAGRRRNGRALRGVWAAAGCLAVLFAVAFEGAAAQPPAQGLQCAAGLYDATGGADPALTGCVSCSPGWASNQGSTACTQVLTGEVRNRVDDMTFIGAWPEFRVSVGDALTVKIHTSHLATGFEEAGERPRLVAAKSWGLPGYATLCGSNAYGSACTNGTGAETWGLLQFAPTAKQQGEVYSVCGEATMSMVPGWVVQPLLVCLRIVVVQVTPTFANSSVLPEYSTFSSDVHFVGAVGCTMEIPLQISPSPCPAPGCTISPAGNASQCSTSCGGSATLVPSVVGQLPSGATLHRRAFNFSEELQLVSSGDVSKYWAITWTPELHSSSQVPYTVCVSPGETGTSRCWEVTVEKCRHCVRTGETLASVAAQHNADWMQLYFSNPTLPSHNPQDVSPGYNLRLGVLYEVQSGEYLEQIAEKFLVEPYDVLSENAELWAESTIEYSPKAPGMSTQLSVAFSASRALMAGETLTLTLRELAAPDWQGSTASSCSVVSTSMHYGSFSMAHIKTCSQGLSAPGESCGPGRWGECEYDADGQIACAVQQCAGGSHPKLGAARWKGGTKMLTIDVAAPIAKGEMVSFVIPRSSGLVYPPRGHPAAKTRVVFPVPMRVNVKEGFVPFEMCVVLPVCDPGLACLYGTDCKISKAVK